jgi:hypothetical protein
MTVLPVLLALILMCATSAHAKAPVSYLVKTVPSGFTVARPGEANRALNRDELHELFEEEPETYEDLVGGDYEAGYVRTWVNRARSGGLVSMVIETEKPISPKEFFEGSEELEPGDKPLTIPGVPNIAAVTGPAGALAIYIKRRHVFLTALIDKRPTDPKMLINIVQQHIKGPLVSLPEATDAKGLTWPPSASDLLSEASRRPAIGAAASLCAFMVTAQLLAWRRHRRQRRRYMVISFG